MLTLRTFTIQRLTGPGGGSKKKSFATTGREISGHLGTANAEMTAMVDGEFGRTFSFVSDEFDADVKIGDRFVEGSDEYDVKGVLKNTDGPGRIVQVILVLPIEQ